MKDLFNVEKDLTEKQAMWALIIFLVLLGFVGKIEFKDELHAAQVYEENVCLHNMPNYKGREIDCF